ncbi:lytic transglycosylase domain-containing protein [Phenylobacterium aquaticum]|uniref:lytic transglycosylase domain-containing protein n=1 Tax=Phenylobacterium aquaticum TaxID=1763816 RepID=UPI001F5D80CD|nr:lytic transglycosylase domain-containing protein [Phenylobacterium aquaticum]MCI3135343.1 lytic transglycosylase domain-containing protein [Phenylobacterium aquaticum]
MLSLPAALVLAQVCAAPADPTTLLSVVAVESRFEPWAIGVNGSPAKSLHPTSREAAEALARQLLAQGRNLDLGLGQINHRNLSRLGLTLEDAFDPCRNLAAAQAVLAANGETVATPDAWRRALSRYNTGGPTRGLANGYVAKVTRAAAEIGPQVRALRDGLAGDAPRAASAPARPDFVIVPRPLSATGDLP